jgi:hypothetical protein
MVLITGTEGALLRQLMRAPLAVLFHTAMHGRMVATAPDFLFAFLLCLLLL